MLKNLCQKMFGRSLWVYRSKAYLDDQPVVRDIDIELE